MAELGEDGQRKADVEDAGISGGVKIEKKGHQTVIQVTNVMTGLPPVTTPAIATPPAYPGMPWMGAATTSPTGVPAVNPWSYYYPPASYVPPIATPSDGSTPAVDPNAAAYAYPTDYSQQAPAQPYDYSQYQQYYAQWYAAQANTQPVASSMSTPPQDTEMG